MMLLDVVYPIFQTLIEVKAITEVYICAVIFSKFIVAVHSSTFLTAIIFIYIFTYLGETKNMVKKQIIMEHDARNT